MSDKPRYSVLWETEGVLVRCEKPCDQTLAFLTEQNAVDGYGIVAQRVMDEHGQKAGHA